MADVSAIFGLLLMSGLAFPGMLTTWWLLFPNVVERAQTRLERTPWRTFWMGIAGLIIFAVPIGILLALPFGPANFFGWIGIFAALTFASLGAAGVAARMGIRLTRQAQDSQPDTAAFVRGAVAFELAAAFPLLGWFIVIPLGVTVSLGAAIFAVLRWQPKPASQPDPKVALETQIA